MMDYQEIKKQIKGEVQTDEATLAKYSRDASIFEILPKCVVFPKDSEDVKSLVSGWPGKSRTIRIYPLPPAAPARTWAAGRLTIPLLPILPRISAKLKCSGRTFRFMEPGVFYRDFEVESLKRGLLLPCYTASKSLNTLGGMVANNSAGEKSLSYGQTKDYVEELHVVLSRRQ